VDASSIHESEVPGSNPGADTLTFGFRRNADRVNNRVILEPLRQYQVVGSTCPE